jgi:hypothetical protein
MQRINTKTSYVYSKVTETFNGNLILSLFRPHQDFGLMLVGRFVLFKLLLLGGLGRNSELTPKLI